MSSTDTLPNFFSDVLQSLKSACVTVNHVESRKGKIAGYDVLADCKSTKGQLIDAASTLTKQHQLLTSFSIYKKKSDHVEIWFPRHISELDKCSKCITKYEPTTDPRHPGHGDELYIARRKFLNDHALEFKQ